MLVYLDFLKTMATIGISVNESEEIFFAEAETLLQQKCALLNAEEQGDREEVWENEWMYFVVRISGREIVEVDFSPKKAFLTDIF